MWKSRWYWTFVLVLGSCLLPMTTSRTSLLRRIGNSFGLGRFLDGLDSCFQQFAKAETQVTVDFNLGIDELILKYGYPVERLNVTTEDGYILRIFRIPFSPKSPLIPGQRKKAVYLNHGIGSNGQQFILQYGDRNLGYLLADAGFDVFISNCRGSSYSQTHVNLSQTETSYWDFSWDEMGRYDVPAVMDLIGRVTGNEKLYYIGYSMGATQYFVALSERPDLNERIHTGFMMAPVVFIPHSTNPIRIFSPLVQDGQYLLNPTVGGRANDLQQLQNYTGLTLGSLCAGTTILCGACSNLLFAIFGFDAPQTNYTNLPLVLPVLVDTQSTKTLVHYAQGIGRSTFRKFDYGTADENGAHYGGSSIPPDYDLSRITAPTVILYGTADNLAVPQDVEFTASKLHPNTLKRMIKVNWPLFNHLDFVIAKDADLLIYNQIKETMLNGTYET